jgi:DHA2 family multidrug resistance protein
LARASRRRDDPDGADHHSHPPAALADARRHDDVRLIVLLGPLLGPVLGGWLAENISWSWCFFINLPVCIALITLLIVGLPSDRPQWSTFLKADWVGIIGLTIGLSSLTVVLEEGQRERWFESSMIVSLTCVSLAGMVLIAISQLTATRPIMRLNLMRNPRYASVIVIVFAVGAGCMACRTCCRSSSA